MPWLPKALSSSPSSRPSSSGSSLKSQPRQLTRAKKLRHLQDEDIKDLDLLRSPARDTESSGNDLSRLTAVENRPTQLSSVVPQRLPLPDLASHHSFGDAVSRNSPSAVDYFPLPSPNRALIKGERDREKLKISDVLARDGTAGASTDYTSESRISHRDARGSSDGRRSFDYGETWLSRDVPQKIMGVDNAQENFGIQVPFRSAPSSGYSSPVLSPQRRSTSDLFSSKQMVHQVWSVPEMPTTTTDMASGFLYAAFQEKTMFKSSPNHSPRVKSPMKPRASTSGPASPRNRKLFIETSVTNYEINGHANGHPLPLPPGAISATQSSPIPQSLAKPELLPVKSQWVKGKLIGRGTFGTVYVATNRETGALCAMKEVELFPDDPKSAECLKQLEQEIKVLSQLKHPNIVQYYGSEIVEDRINIYLEYVHPGSINKYIREHGVAITESVVRNFTRHILSGLAYLHSTKTIHRDIKGANLLVDAFGVVKLADFGMAKHLSGQAAILSLKGSPYWMAPELMHAVMQKDNNSDLALAVDIWSLGCTIIEMLTGKPPWSEFEGAAAMFKVLRESPPFPETLSSEGKDFLRWCFQRNPADRPSASMLLKHRFVRNSLPLDVPSHLAFNGLNLTDRAYSPRELHGPKLDQMPMTPTRQAAKARLVSNNETGTQSLPETCNLMPIHRHSPQSTLEALPSPSPPRSGHSLTTLLPGPAKHLCFY